nr:uncharacterized protein LOC101414023 [Dasypus novemcinctus]
MRKRSISNWQKRERVFSAEPRSLFPGGRASPAPQAKLSFLLTPFLAHQARQFGQSTPGLAKGSKSLLIRALRPQFPHLYNEGSSYTIPKAFSAWQFRGSVAFPKCQGPPVSLSRPLEASLPHSLYTDYHPAKHWRQRNSIQQDVLPQFLQDQDVERLGCVILKFLVLISILISSILFFLVSTSQVQARLASWGRCPARSVPSAGIVLSLTHLQILTYPSKASCDVTTSHTFDS